MANSSTLTAGKVPLLGAAGTLLLFLSAVPSLALRPFDAHSNASSPSDLSDLEKRLRVAIGTGNESDLKNLIDDVASIESKRSTSLLFELTVGSPQLVHALIVQRLARCESEQFWSHLRRQAVSAKKPIERLLSSEVLLQRCLALTGKEGVEADESSGADATDETKSSPQRFPEKDREALREVLWDDPPFLPLSLLDQLAKQPTTATIDLLVEALEKAPRRRSHGVESRIIDTLRQLTKIDMQLSADWINWWQGSSQHFEFPVDSKNFGSAVISRVRARGLGPLLDEMKDTDILVIPGSFDQVEIRLAEMRLPFTTIERKQIPKRRINPHQVLVFNCHDKSVGSLSPRGFAMVRDFVKRGGYLFTSDWELQNVLLGSFPKEFRAGALTAKEKFWTPIEPPPGVMAHPYLRDVVPAHPLQRKPLHWQIDPASMVIQLRPSRTVTPLLVSKELEKRWGSGIVAAHVRFGEGSILHVLGHFKDQGLAENDAEALQQLLVNFIVEKMEKNRRKRAELERPEDD